MQGRASNEGRYCSIGERAHQGPSGAIRRHQAPSVAIRRHQWPSVAISDHQWPSGAIRGHQWPSGAISGHQWSSGTCSMGESGCGSVESASRSSGTSSFGSVYLWGRNGAVVSTCMRARREVRAPSGPCTCGERRRGPARRAEHVHASASRGTSSFQIRGGTYMMQFENWRKKALDGWSGMSTCRMQREIRRDHAQSSGDQR